MNTDKNAFSRRDFLGFAGAAGAFLMALPGVNANAVEPAKPQSDPICLIPETRIAGTTHVTGIAGLVDALNIGDELVLERDPENPWDGNAILVLNARGQKLGFIPRAENAVIARLMDGGKRVFAKVMGIELIGSWFKIPIGVWLDD